MANQTGQPECRIRITESGPYVVSGGIPLREVIIAQDEHGNVFRPGCEFPQQEMYALCRCGESKNHPFCDGSHVSCGFHGKETAEREAYDSRADLQEGPELDLLDDQRCAFARFCHRDGISVWDLVDDSDSPASKRDAIRAASECPAGRLTAFEKDGRRHEPLYAPAIEIMQDPEKHSSAGIFVKGPITIESADGSAYEVRNRVALCRCGKSKNKPFCDAMHVAARFSDKKR